jgi:hypothetical protein
MKKILISILLSALVSLSFHVSAQLDSTSAKTRESQPLTSLTIGTGINSNVGVLGLQIEHKLAGPLSFYAGAGIGGWGYKLTAGARLYIRHQPIGSAFGLSFSNATGVNKVKSELQVVENGREVKKEIEFNAKPVNTLNFSWLRYWKMGKQNRFNLELGYSLLLNTPTESNYTIVTPGVTITDDSKSVMNAIQPGGILIAVGFNFGL